MSEESDRQKKDGLVHVCSLPLAVPRLVSPLSLHRRMKQFARYYFAKSWERYTRRGKGRPGKKVVTNHFKFEFDKLRMSTAAAGITY